MRCYLTFCALALASVLFAETPHLAGKKFSTPPKIDGVVEAEEWNAAATASGFVDSSTGAPAEGGQFWLGYDEHYIYFAAHLESAGKPIATQYRSNVNIESDDSVFLAIEPFGNINNPNIFGINARGASEIKISGGRAPKREWLGEFQSAGHIGEGSWEIEARIPWGVMRLPAPGVRSLRFAVIRVNPKVGRQTSWTPVNASPDALPFWDTVEIPASGNRRSLKLLPFVYGGASSEETIANAGLDFKTSISDRMEAVGTINPDFRNIENQVLSLDFSYLERLAGESRPFFLEGADFFTSSRDEPLFVSQRIRRFDAGFKTFGQIDPSHEFGFLDTIDFGNENALVVKFRNRFSPRSSLEVEYAGLHSADGPQNDGGFISYNNGWGPFGMFAHHIATNDSVAGYGKRTNAGGFYDANGLHALGEYVEVSPDFLPRVGFAPLRDIRGYLGNVDVSRTIPHGHFQDFNVGVSGFHYTTFSGDPFWKGIDSFFEITDRHQYTFGAFANFEHFLTNSDHLVGLSLTRFQNDVYHRTQVSASQGQLLSHRYEQVSASISMRPFSLLQMSASIEAVHHFSDEARGILSFNYDLGMDQSVSGRWIQDRHRSNAYVSYKRSGNRGAEYYVILGNPSGQSFGNSLVVKAVLPFELRF